MDASAEVDDAFPDALKEPILRKVQFSIISRIDNLGKCSIPSTNDVLTQHADVIPSQVDHIFDVRLMDIVLLLLLSFLMRV